MKALKFLKELEEIELHYQGNAKLRLGEANKFLPIDKIDLYQDSIGYVELYDASHANESEAQRVWTVTQICSLAYGNESAKNPEALYERMKSIKHESLWEFIRTGKQPSYNQSSVSCNTNEIKIEGSMRNDVDYPYSSNKEHSENIACFRIKVPMFVARQFMRHRSFSYLEMSRRYTKGAKVPFEFWFPKDFSMKEAYLADYKHEYELLASSEMYETQIASRFLPQTTYTEFYMMGEVEGLKNFFRLRCDSHAQSEIRETAEVMLELLRIHQPELYKKVLP